MEENTYLCTDNETKQFMNFKDTFTKYGYNISTMAEKMGMAQPNLSRQINQGTINIKQLEQMAEICGVSLAEFVGADIDTEMKVVKGDAILVYELKRIER